MFPCHFKIAGHSGDAQKPKSPFQQYKLAYRNHKLPAPIKGSERSYEHRVYHQNSLIASILILILLGIILYLGRSITHDVFLSHRTRSNRESIEAVHQSAYRFLTKSGYQYYRNGNYGLALEEVRLAHRLDPTGYKVNYINTITLIALCKQRGIYCDEAILNLNYLDENWMLDKEWLETQQLTLGIIE